jgi:hypothetical protein
MFRDTFSELWKERGVLYTLIFAACLSMVNDVLPMLSINAPAFWRDHNP